MHFLPQPSPAPSPSFTEQPKARDKICSYTPLIVNKQKISKCLFLELLAHRGQPSTVRRSSEPIGIIPLRLLPIFTYGRKLKKCSTNNLAIRSWMKQRKDWEALKGHHAMLTKNRKNNIMWLAVDWDFTLILHYAHTMIDRLIDTSLVLHHCYV